MALPDLKVTSRQHLTLLQLLVEDTMSAERESHFHEIYSEILYYFCRTSDSTQVYFSVAPQFELGHQIIPTNVDEPIQGLGILTRAEKRAQGFLDDDLLSLGDVSGSLDFSTASIDFSGTFSDDMPSTTEEDWNERAMNDLMAGVDIADKSSEDPSFIGHSPKADTPKTTWRKPDFLVIARFTDGIVVIGRKVVLILELKMDPECFDITDDRTGGIEETSAVVVAQVLLQAQYVFSEFPEQESVHAIVAVGLYFKEFRIDRSVLPPLSGGHLYDDKKTLTPRQAVEFLGFTRDLTEFKCILNEDRTSYNDHFLSAWGKARAPYDHLRVNHSA